MTTAQIITLTVAVLGLLHGPLTPVIISVLRRARPGK